MFRLHALSIHLCLQAMGPGAQPIQRRLKDHQIRSRSVQPRRQLKAEVVQRPGLKQAIRRFLLLFSESPSLAPTVVEAQLLRRSRLAPLVRFLQACAAPPSAI
jgi:hypothetical protein